MKRIIYRGDNGSFVGKQYIYDGGACFDQHHGKLKPLEEAEVYKAYSEGKYDVVNDSIVADERYVYGTRAYDIYEEMCHKYGWHLFERNKFLQHNELYAANATQEGYSVHFLCHNNWSETDNGTWINMIYDDRIEESWPTDLFYKPKYHHVKGEKRVVFAHNANGYAFIGVYQTVNWKKQFDFHLCKDRIIKVYKLVSKVYPILDQE